VFAPSNHRPRLMADAARRGRSGPDTARSRRLGPPGTPITDRETGSIWSITGVATDGDMAGTQLDRIVSADHLWFSWAAFNPETRIWEPPLADGSDELG
jgi:hypothetical protein